MPVAPGGWAVKPYERKQLLERLDREGATVGVTIPNRLDVQGEPVDLRSFVMELKRRGSLPPGERERLDRAKRSLRRERRERVERLETADVAREDGEALVESILGIDRALEALSQLEPGSITEAMEAREVADRRRWRSFLREVTGDGSSDPRRRRR